MDPTSTLELIAQLAAAMAGFSSVVVAYGKRHERGWTASDRIRLSLLVGDSLAVMFFALLPMVLQSFAADAAVAWGLSSASLGLYVLTRSLLILPRIRGNVGAGDGLLHPVVITLTTVCLLGTVALRVVNLLWSRSLLPGPFVAGLWLLLSCASMQFLRLVFTSLDS
jgi:hypothetical protein